MHWEGGERSRMGSREAGTSICVPGASLRFFRCERFYHKTASMNRDFCGGWNFNPNLNSNLPAVKRGSVGHTWMGYG